MPPELEEKQGEQSALPAKEEESPLEKLDDEGEEGSADELDGELDKDGQDALDKKLSQEKTVLEKSESSEANDRLRQIEAENIYLKGQLRAYVEGAAPPKRTSQVDDEEAEESDEEIHKALRENPVATLKKREARLREQIKKELQGGLKKSDEERTQHDLDIRTMYKQYPEIDSDASFRERASLIYNGLTERLGKIPGLQTAAASIAYGQMVREGYIQPKRNGLRETVVRKTSDPMLRDRNKPSGETPAGDALEGYTEKDKLAIRRACKSLKITPKEWLESYEAMKKENPEYGRG